MIRLFIRTLPILVLFVLVAQPIHGQEKPILHGPFTALWSAGDRLYIGEGSTLVAVRVTPDDLRVEWEVEIGRGELRDIKTGGQGILALTESGLVWLNLEGQILAIVRGGGHRLAVADNRAYVAALTAGLRIYGLDNTERFSNLGTLATTGPAFDVIPVPQTYRVWVAEGPAGLRLYDMTDLAAIKTLNTLADPVEIIRQSGPRLFIAQNETITTFDFSDPSTPKPLGIVRLGALIADLAVVGNRVYAGLSARDGADAVALNVAFNGTSTVIARFGEYGAGERLALHGDDLFIGSRSAGLQRVRFGRGDPALIAHWDTPSPVTKCIANAPTDPSPPDLAQVTSSPVILGWQSGCAAAFEIHVNGVPVATLRADKTASDSGSGKGSYTYTFAPQSGAIRWQIVAIDAEGKRAAGPEWRFEAMMGGWIATPVPVPLTGMLYRAPLIKLDTPGGVLLATCFASCAGLGVIIIGAWFIGKAAANSQRDQQKIPRNLNAGRR